MEDRSQIRQIPLPGIRVIASRDRGEEIYTLLSNENGAFRFSNLRPGAWTVRVVTDQIPALHEWSQSEIRIELKGEDEKEIIFKAVPVRRIMQPIDQ